jgi:epoxyqueuosine reductase
VSDTVRRIRESARRIGFDAVALGTIRPGEEPRRLLDWLRDGLGADLDYMAEAPEDRADPRRRFPWARGVVAVALRHDPGRRPGTEAPAEAEGPRGFVARYARGDDYHGVLEGRLKRLRDAVVRAGGPGTRAWWATDHAPVLDRALARDAGLGFFGKNTMLIRPGAGSYLLLGEVLTSLELRSDRAPAGSCGTCTRCLDICPTRAFPAPFRLDAGRCISYLTIENRGPIPEGLRRGVGTMVFGCDLCQEVCPWNRFARSASARDLRPRALAADPDLIALAGMGEAEWRAAFRGSAVLRAGWTGWRRNLAVALGNSGDRAALPALRALASCGDALVEEHARWGIESLDAHH